MRGWERGNGEYHSHVWDKGYREPLSLMFDEEDECLTVENVTLDGRGITALRRKLEQVERHIADKTRKAAS